MIVTNLAMLKLKKNQNQKPKKSKLWSGTAKVVLLSLTGLSLAFADVMRLKVNPGAKEVKFSLPSNPTTGYRWSVSHFDASKLKMLRAKYHGKATHLMGAGGKQDFHFQVIHPNQSLDTQIDLVYARPWEKKAVKSETVMVKTSPFIFNVFKW